MPELPEVEHVRRTLVPHLVGHRLTAVSVRRPSVIAGTATPDALLVGSGITAIERRGKQIALIADSGRALVIQLGMSGQVLCQPAASGPGHTSRKPLRDPSRRDASVSERSAFPPSSQPAPSSPPDLPTHVHVVWTTSLATRILFRDPRRFGGITPLASLGALNDRWSALGPDALTIDPAALAERLRGSRRPIKAALLDQSVLAGVGNIYADEVCFRTAIRPRRSAHRLGTGEIERLASCIRSVLAAAVEAGGSTLRDYLDADGRPGSYRQEHSVYGRGGQPCLTCSARLRITTIAQRTTVYCPNCQPASTIKTARSALRHPSM